MRVGIYLTYQRLEESYAAIQLAELAKQNGIDVEVACPLNEGIVGVDPYWDNKVFSVAPVDFSNWASRYSTTVMFSGHTDFKLSACQAESGRLVLVIPGPRMVDEDHRSSLNLADYIVTPSPSASGWVSSLGLTSYPVPFCPPFDPIVGSGANRTVLIPMRGSQPQRTGEQLVQSIDTLLSSDSTVKVVVTYLATHWHPRSRRRIHEMTKRWGERFRAIDNPPQDDAMLLMGEAGVVLNPAVADEYCLPTICSMFMGTPVVGFGVPPTTDYVVPGSTGSLVFTEHIQDRDERWLAIPDYDLLFAETMRLLDSPVEISTIHADIADHCRRWKHTFRQRWLSLLK